MSTTDDKKIFIEAADVYAAIGDGWPEKLEQMGVESAYLRKKHGPCPACGGKDRYRFDNRHKRGDFYCNGCGAGDGIGLLMRVNGWTFIDTLKALAESLGLKAGDGKPPAKKKYDSTVVITANGLNEKRREAAARAERLWQKTGEPNPDHPYLVRKAIEPHGIRQLGRLLVVPMRNHGGKLWSLQFIPPEPDKKKTFLKHSRTKELFHIIGERTEEVKAGSRGNHYALMVDDMDAWEEHLVEKKIGYEPRRTRPDGAYQLFFFDPDGHAIELFIGPPTA